MLAGDLVMASRQCGLVVVWRLGVVAAALLLAGCGAGDVASIDSFYGTGTSPGSVFSQSLPGRLVGDIVQNTTTNHILILASGPPAAGETAVVGATVAIAAQKLSTTTAADGTYDIENVAPGNVNVTITLPTALGGSSATFLVNVQPGATVSGIPNTNSL
jgi:hypothetical protein